MFFSWSLLTGCRRLALDGTVDDKLVGKVADISFESVAWLSIWPVVVANWRSNDGSV
jgi:hypothetical protein